MGQLWADNAGIVPALPAAPATSGVLQFPHLTDAQDRLLPADLSPEAEAKAHANALYAEAMQTSPDNPPLAALDKLRQVVALDPHFAEAQMGIATILLQLGQAEPARQQLKAAANANPESVDIEAMLGYVEHLRGNNDEAVRLGTDALTRNSNQTTAMRVLLDTSLEQDNLAGGVTHIEDILKADGNHVTSAAWLTLARLYLEVTRNDPDAPPNGTVLKTLLPIYQQAAAKAPPDVETLTLLADAYRNLDRKTEALAVLQKADALDPSNVDIILRCANLETDLGQKSEALKNYEEAYALNPGLTGLRETLGRLYLSRKRYDDAVRLLQEAFVDSPRNLTLGSDLCTASEKAGHPEEAEKCFQQIFDSDSCPPEVYLQLAVFQLAREKIHEAGVTLSAAQKRFPLSSRVLFYQAIQHRYEKNYTAALACLDQMRALTLGSPNDGLDINYYVESVLTLGLANRKDQIAPTLREGLDKFPQSPDLMNELAYFWADEGTHLPEALSLSRRAVELEPQNGPIQDTCGWVYFQMGEAKDALPYLQRAALLTNNDPVVLQHMGDAYLKLGLRSEALAAWRRALEKDPRNGDLANRIDAASAQAKHAQHRSAPTP